MKIVIIGGVAAGMSAAAKARRMSKDAEIIVIEKGREVSYGACGLPYYVSGVNEELNLMRMRTAAEFCRSGIEIRLQHEAIQVIPNDKKVILRENVTGRQYEEMYDKLLIAAGANPIIPNIKGAEKQNVFTLRTLEDGVAMREIMKQPNIRNIIIVGGGYIGMELVETAVTLKKQVRVVEAAESVMSNFDKEITDFIEQGVRKSDVILHTGEIVKEIIGDSSVREVVTDKGQYEADAVILAVGVRPNTRFMEDAQIARLPNGAIIVDEEMRTNIEHIYAAGDCATVRHRLLQEQTYIPLGTNANKQGRIAGENMFGAHKKLMGVLGTAMAKILDLEVAKTGLTEKEAQRHGIPYDVVSVITPNHAPYYPNPTPIKIKLVYHSETKVVLGAQLAGYEGVALRANVFAACIHAGMTAEEIGGIDFGYAPPFSMPWDAVHVAANAVK